MGAVSGAIHSFQTNSVANAVLLFPAAPFFAALLGLVLPGGLMAMVAGAIGAGLTGQALLVPARDMARAFGRGAVTLAGAVDPL